MTTQTFDPAAYVQETETSGRGSWTPARHRSSSPPCRCGVWARSGGGRVGGLSGTAIVSNDGLITAHLSADATTVDTKHKKRDSHLRSSTFFDVENHPTVDVRVERIVLTGPTKASASAQVTIAGCRSPGTRDRLEGQLGRPRPDFGGRIRSRLQLGPVPPSLF